MKKIDYNYNQIWSTLYDVGTTVRKCLENKYVFKAPELYGCCVEASNMIITQLNILGISAQICAGWVFYDYPERCSDEPCDPHFMVKVPYQDSSIYVDVTATQFQFCLSEQIPKVLISKKCPYWFVEGKEKPKELLIEEFPEWYEELNEVL